MATTVATNEPPPTSSGLKLESLTHIDVSKLSQSELHALSLCSSSAFDLRHNDDVVMPQIDRSLFNESAGSRRQTYSRLRIRHPHHRTTRLPGLLPNSDPKPLPCADPENHSILHFLKHFLHHGLNSAPPPPPPPPTPPPEQSNEVISFMPQQFELGSGLEFEKNMLIGKHSMDIKRKRGRKAKRNWNVIENGVGTELQVMNKKGDMVDFALLESKGDSLYDEQLKKRTVGLETEEAILGFLTNLEGQWCSRRKKRKYVDASDLGDVLPIGWKLLLSLKRREGRASVYCRRYISPCGQEFISCKEVALYLRSYFALYDAKQLLDVRTLSIQQNAGISLMPADQDLDIVPCATLPTATISDLHQCEISLDNLSEVQVHDLFDCYKCNLNFDEKNAYLEHLFSFHQQTTKRVKFGRPVGEGVIVENGNYECQFCHKIFEERHKYNGHVGIHVRNVRGSDELGVPVSENKNIESPTRQELSFSTSAIEVVVENAGDTTLETSTPGLAAQNTENSSPSKTSFSKAPITVEQLNLGSDPCENETEECEVEEARPEELNQHEGERIDVDDSQHVEVTADTKSNNNDVCLTVVNVETYGNSKGKMDFASQEDSANSRTIVDASGQIVEANVPQNEVEPSSEYFMQSLDYFPAAASNKGDDNFSVVDQKLEVAGFEEMRLDGVGPFRYNFTEVPGSPSFAGSSFDLGNGAEMDEGFGSSARFSSEEVILNMEGRNTLTTLCVWCSSEFKLEAVDADTQSDTIGYMCPTCKDKISGHLANGYP